MHRCTIAPSVVHPDMDDKLRNLKYNQTAEFTVGRSAGGNNLIFSTYEIDTYCEYTASYTVSFEYGLVNADTHDFDGPGGIIGLQFFIESTNEHFNETKTSSTKAGDMIFLTLQLNRTVIVAKIEIKFDLFFFYFPQRDLHIYILANVSVLTAILTTLKI